MNYPLPQLTTLIAVDPGVSGAFAVLNQHGVHLFHMPDSEDRIVALIDQIVYESRASLRAPYAVVEQINGFMGNALPGSRMFTMGSNYGFVRGALKALHVPVQLVGPRKWQGDLSLKKEKEMNRNKWKQKLCCEAKALYPLVKVTQQDADALLLLHWARLSVDSL